MNRLLILLGGRKFLGFLGIVIVALAMELSGHPVTTNIVSLLLGAYGLFAGSNALGKPKGLAPQQLAEINNAFTQVAAQLQQALAAASDAQEKIQTLSQAQELTNRGVAAALDAAQGTPASRNRAILEKAME